MLTPRLLRVATVVYIGASLGMWLRQGPLTYHGYGYWKMPLFAARPSSLRLRHLVPAGAVLRAMLLGLGSLLTRRPLLPLAIGGYVAVAAIFEAKIGVAVGRRRG